MPSLQGISSLTINKRSPYRAISHCPPCPKLYPPFINPEGSHNLCLHQVPSHCEASATCHTPRPRSTLRVAVMDGTSEWGPRRHRSKTWCPSPTCKAALRPGALSQGINEPSLLTRAVDPWYEIVNPRGPDAGDGDVTSGCVGHMVKYAGNVCR